MARIDLLIVQPFQDYNQFVRSNRATIVLVDALKRHKINFRTVSPWDEYPRVADYNCILFWVWGYQSPRRESIYVNLYEKVRLDAVKQHIKFYPTTDSTRAYHSYCLSRWNLANIPCPKFKFIQHIKDFEGMTFPIILRRDRKYLRGKYMFLANSKIHASQIYRQRRRVVDIATEFIDTRNDDGYYRKYRSIVVGNDVHARQLQLSNNWMVHLNKNPDEAQELALKEDRYFIEHGESDAELLIKASNAIGLEIGAVDYSRTKSGGIVIWESNKAFGMAGLSDTPKSIQFRESTGRSKEIIARQFAAIGDSLVKLVTT